MNIAIKKTPAKWLLPLNWVTLLIILAALLVFILTLLALINENAEFDQVIGKNILSHRYGFLTSFMATISILGSTEFLAVANLTLIIFFIIRKDKWTALRIFIVASTSYAILKTLKALLQRARPDEPIIAALKNYSFPSGHAFMAVAFYGFIICWVMLGVREKKIRNVVIASMIFLVVIIGYSRVYLGVHYATDVLAGWGLGTAWLLISLLIIDKVSSARHPD